MNAPCVVPFKNNFRYIDWNQDQKTLLNHIRAHASPYSGSLAYTSKGNEIIIWEAKALDVTRSPKGPGFYTVGDRGKDMRDLIIQTCSNPILVTRWEQNSINEIKLVSGRFVSGVPE